MNRIHISKLIITGEKGTSTLEFGEKLTIITGPSDTGKSYIYKCIYYLLGSKSTVPFDSSIGYDTISLVLRKGLEDITLTRKIGESQIAVTNGNDQKTYKLSGGKSETIDDFFAEFLELPKNLKVPKNEDGQTQKFSIRTLKPLLMVREDDTDIEKPILLPETGQATTAFLSCLLYLLYDQDFSEFDAEENKKTKAAKKAAVQKYIISNKEKLINQKNQLEKILNEGNIDSSNIEDVINKLQQELDQINEVINKAIIDLRETGIKIVRQEDSIRKKKVLLERYKVLESQYLADIERLGFIVQGEKIIHKHNSPAHCPYCDGEIKKKQEGSYLEASKAEVKKIIVNSEELSKTIKDTQQEISSLLKELEEFQSVKNSIDNTLKNELNPKKTSIVNQINQFKTYIESTNELRVISSLLDTLETDLSNLDATVDQRKPYKPKELFAEDFKTTISNIYLRLLENVNFSPINSAEFDMSSFDIIVNGEHKKSHGKGYRSLLNSLLILSMREYINSVAVHNPHYYMIDSPLHGLTMPNGVEETQNVRRGFFKYLIDNIGDDQIIIIENVVPNDIPENVNSNPDVKIIEFTQDEENGRYGLLKGVRKS